jgi:diguanylate cyclase (GGDEF)-like protein
MSKHTTTDQLTEVFARPNTDSKDAGGLVAYLVVIQGPDLGRQLALSAKKAVIGRSVDVDFRLKAPGISRNHCLVEKRSDGWWVKDLGSTNHTHVNKDEVSEQKLADGDRIRIGQSVMKFIDIGSPEAAYHDKLLADATRDSESGLYNRRHFQSSLLETVNLASRAEGDFHGGVFYLMLDNYPDLRDRIGISGIEALLGQIGKRVAGHLAGSHLPARFGEYSMVVLATDIEAGELHSLADEMRKLVSAEVFETGESEVAAAVSVGVCAFSLRINDADAMLVCATKAAEKAHAAGGNRCEVYQPAISANTTGDDQAMVGLLREALSQNSIQVMYQPAVNICNEDLTHFHLLPRLHTDDGQLIPAARFVPAAEQHGHVLALDRWMCERALSVIREQLGNSKKLKLIISQSADSLTEGEHFLTQAEALEPEISDNRLLVIEFRLADLTTHLKHARQLLPRLRELGLGLSISGITHEASPDPVLAHIQVDYVKLSPSFTHDLGSDDRVFQQLETLVNRVHEAGARVIVPHVENAETMSRLWTSNADFLLGNFIQQPSQVPDFSL